MGIDTLLRNVISVKAYVAPASNAGLLGRQIRDTKIPLGRPATNPTHPGRWKLWFSPPVLFANR
jgi:hypothetical protein